MIEAIIGVAMTVLSAIAVYLIREGSHRREHKVITDTLEKHGIHIDRNEERHNQNDVVVATILTKLDFIVEQVSTTNDKLTRMENK